MFQSTNVRDDACIHLPFVFKNERCYLFNVCAGCSRYRTVLSSPFKEVTSSWTYFSSTKKNGTCGTVERRLELAKSSSEWNGLLLSSQRNYCMSVTCPLYCQVQDILHIVNRTDTLCLHVYWHCFNIETMSKLSRVRVMKLCGTLCMLPFIC